MFREDSSPDYNTILEANGHDGELKNELWVHVVVCPFRIQACKRFTTTHSLLAAVTKTISPQAIGEEWPSAAPGKTIRFLQRETQKTNVLWFERRTSRCAGDAQCRVHFQPTWPSDILGFHRHSQSVFFPDMSLTGQNAVVVGGGTGMGEAIALGLANEGANVIVAGRRQAKLDEVAEKDEKISTQTALSLIHI